MPNKDQIIATLRAHEAELRAKGVEGLYLFGSVARGDAREGSDVDLFFDHGPKMGMSFFEVKDILTFALPTPVDVTTRGALHPLAKSRIEHEAERIF